MASLRKRGKLWYYRFVDADGVKQERKGCADKRATQEMAGHVEREAAREKAGLIDPREAAYARHETRPLTDHLEDWHAFLTGKGSTRQHALLSRNRSMRLIDLARATRIGDLSPSRVQAALASVRTGGASLQSLHHYTRAIKGLSRWLWRDARSRADALAHMQGVNAQSDRRHERRALDVSELDRLISAAASGLTFQGLSGPDRATLYRLAVGTGFRVNELRSLTPESFRLDSDPPSVVVSAAYSKRRRDDDQPIRHDLASALRPWLTGKPPALPVFGTLTTKTAEMIRHDLESAGIAYRDDSGRVADFHALRHTYITLIVRGGASVKTAQSLARHSTPVLTIGRYAHASLHDMTSGLEGLPGTPENSPSTEARSQAATGTEGPRIGVPLAHHLPTGRGGQRQELAGTGGVEGGPVASGPATLPGPNSLSLTGLGGDRRGLTGPGGAEGVGFEPTDLLRGQRFSRPSP